MCFDINWLGHDYPGGKSEDDIKKLIQCMQTKLSVKNYQPNYVAQLTPLIQMGLYELENRKNKRVTRLAQTVGSVSALVAVIALIISLIGTFSSSEWEAKQMNALNNIRINMSTAKNQENSYVTLQSILNIQSDQQKALVNLKDRLNKELCTKQLAVGEGAELRTCE